jgi:hypothetical protein
MCQTKQYLIFSVFLVLYSFLNVSLASERGHFAIRHAQVQLQHGVYILSSDLEYQLSKEHLKALHNAVSLPVTLEISVYRKRSYWLDEEVLALQQHYRLNYRSLSTQYELLHLNTDLQTTYHTLHAALQALGRLRDFPLLEEQKIDTGSEYYVRLQSYLDIESLPVSLRAVAYLSNQWRLMSEIYFAPFMQS